MNCLLNPNPTTPICSPSIPEQELRLSSFIHVALKQARTNQYSSEDAMQLLNRAWEAQKLLWQLRTERILQGN